MPGKDPTMSEIFSLKTVTPDAAIPEPSIPQLVCVCGQAFDGVTFFPTDEHWDKRTGRVCEDNRVAEAEDVTNEVKEEE